jgi:phage terminase large subunit
MRGAVDRFGKKIYREYFGLDFGYTNDPTAFTALMIDEKQMTIYIFDEIYRTMMKNRDIYNTIKYKQYNTEEITADNEDPRTIDELRDIGLSKIKKSKKGKGSVNAGIQKLLDYKIIVHPNCANTIVELENYSWEKDKETDKFTNTPIGEFNHLMDALRYATEDLLRPTFTWH